jgi:hypothetical protein
MTESIKQPTASDLSASAGSTPFFRANGVFTEYFIIGNPQREAYVFSRDITSRKVSHRKMVGVFDDYKRVYNVPKWARTALAESLLSNAQD